MVEVIEAYSESGEQSGGESNKVDGFDAECIIRSVEQLIKHLHNPSKLTINGVFEFSNQKPQQFERG